MYSVVINEAAGKFLEKLVRSNRRTAERIKRKIDELKNNPRPPGAIVLSGHDEWRVRVGSYRIIYRIEDDVLIVTVIRIGDRKDVYRRV